MELLHRIEFWTLVAYVVLSAVASVLNGWIRETTEGGEVVRPWVLKVAAAVNALAVNMDKARQLWSGYRGPSGKAAP